MENTFLKKLQIKPGYSINIIDAPENTAAIFENIPSNVTVYHDALKPCRAIIIFSTSKIQLNHQLQRHIKSVSAETILWIFYPKKSAKIPSDLDLMKSWRELSIFEVSPCASAAVNETWTGLRLKLQSEVKKSGIGNEEIKQNEYGRYIDPIKRTVQLPEDLAAALALNMQALNRFNTLAYSNKKEYVLWILTAKQEKTRLSRIEKAINMLANGQKNPTLKP